jgi:hypothetical protein
MRTFFKLSAFYVVLLAFVTGIYLLVIYLRPDLVDDFYYRFTTPRANSIILGGSRAAQGILPDVINKRVTTGDNRIINHSFALGPSSYGPNYLREVKKKLKKQSTEGVFILSVNPWSLATGSSNVEDDSTKFFEVERELFVGNLKRSDLNPNLEYLFKYWNNKFSVFENAFKQLIHYKGLIELHPDGWLEVSISMEPEELKERIERSTDEYRGNESIFSNTRLMYLEKIIRYLQNYGAVYLVRLPVSEGMRAIETDKFPDFDLRILELARKCDISYINLIGASGEYLTTDTHHLWKEDAIRVTERLCDSLIHDRSRVSPYSTSLESPACGPGMASMTKSVLIQK